MPPRRGTRGRPRRRRTSRGGVTAPRTASTRRPAAARYRPWSGSDASGSVRDPIAAHPGEGASRRSARRRAGRSAEESSERGKAEGSPVAVAMATASSSSTFLQPAEGRRGVGHRGDLPGPNGIAILLGLAREAVGPGQAYQAGEEPCCRGTRASAGRRSTAAIPSPSPPRRLPRPRGRSCGHARPRPGRAGTASSPARRKSIDRRRVGPVSRRPPSTSGTIPGRGRRPDRPADAHRCAKRPTDGVDHEPAGVGGAEGIGCTPKSPARARRPPGVRGPDVPRQPGQRRRPRRSCRRRLPSPSGRTRRSSPAGPSRRSFGRPRSARPGRRRGRRSEPGGSPPTRGKCHARLPAGSASMPPRIVAGPGGSDRPVARSLEFSYDSGSVSL